MTTAEAVAAMGRKLSELEGELEGLRVRHDDARRRADAAGQAQQIAMLGAAPTEELARQTRLQELEHANLASALEVASQAHAQAQDAARQAQARMTNLRLQHADTLRQDEARRIKRRAIGRGLSYLVFAALLVVAAVWYYRWSAGGLFLATPENATLNAGPPGQTLSGRSTTAPTAVPLATTTLAGATYTANFETHQALPTPGSVRFGRYALAYQAGHAMLNQCLGGSSRCYWGLDHAGWTAIAATAASQTEWGVLLRVGPSDWFDRQGAGDAAAASINPARGEYQIRMISGNGTNDVSVGSGSCACINRSGANTVEFAVIGAELQLKVNGVAVTSVPDSQGARGTGYGVFLVQNLGQPVSLDLTYFAAK